MTAMQARLGTLTLGLLLGCSAPRPVVDAPTTSEPVASARPPESKPLPVASDVHVEETPLHAGETWSGTYTCPQGVTQLGLRIRRVDGYDVEATFAFLHAPSGATGEYALRGRYTPGTRHLRFVAGDWIKRPPGYETVDLAGDISADGRSFAGRIESPECGEFSVQRPP
jgi:hypothetical protein